MCIRDRQVGGFCLDARVQIDTVPGLNHCAQRALEAVVFLPSKQLRTTEASSQMLHDAHCLIVLQGMDDCCTSSRSDHALIVVVIQQVEREAVLPYDVQECCCLISCQFSPIGNISNQTDSLIELLQASLVSRVALEKVLTQYVRSPDAELRATF